MLLVEVKDLKSCETDFGFSGCIRHWSVEAPTSWMFIGKVNCLARCGTVEGIGERDCASAGSPPSIGFCSLVFRHVSISVGSLRHGVYVVVAAASSSGTSTSASTSSSTSHKQFF